MSYVAENDWTWDTTRLKSELARVLSDHGGVSMPWESGSLNGLSLTSQDGTLASGFNMRLGVQWPPYKEQDHTQLDPEVYFNLEYAKLHKLYHMIDHEKETAACTGIWKEIIDFLHESNMNPRRCRLLYIHGTGEIKPHTAGNFYRFHIPIISDEGADFVHGNENTIMQEGNSYLTYVHPYHSMVNESGKDRWHFVADVWDTDGNFEIGKTSHAQWLNEQRNAKLWRDFVNGERYSPVKIQIGEKN
jgi:hypothetical protein